MTQENNGGVEKVNPATREMLPDDPLEMHGFELPGDPDLMLRLLVEEYARIGSDVESIMELAENPNYRAFHRFYRLFGADVFRSRVAEIIARSGVIRVTTTESQPISDRLIQIERP